MRVPEVLVDPNLERRLRRLAGQGWSDAQIARELEYSDRTIWWWRKLLGITGRPTGSNVRYDRGASW